MFVRDNKQIAEHNNHKAFEKWLTSKYTNGVPSSEELEDVYQDDHLLHYRPPLHQSVELPGEGFSNPGSPSPCNQ